MNLALLTNVLNVIDQPLLTGLELVWWAAAFSTALMVFVNIQRYYNDPHRKEFERQWYEQFIAAQRQRYTDQEIDWRAKDLGLHFGYQFTDRETMDEWRDSQMSVWPMHRRKPS